MIACISPVYCMSEAFLCTACHTEGGKCLQGFRHSDYSFILSLLNYVPAGWTDPHQVLLWQADSRCSLLLIPALNSQTCCEDFKAEANGTVKHMFLDYQLMTTVSSVWLIRWIRQVRWSVWLSVDCCFAWACSFVFYWTLPTLTNFFDCSCKQVLNRSGCETCSIHRFDSLLQWFCTRHLFVIDFFPLWTHFYKQGLNRYYSWGFVCLISLLWQNCNND